MVAILQQSADKLKQETENDGLIINSAIYKAAENADIPPLDVTVALQSLVLNSKLVIPAGRSKSGLIGFYDTCLGEAKVLQVNYTFKGRPHVVEVADLQALVMPLRAHAIGI